MDIFLLLWHFVDTSANYLSKITSQEEFAINLNWFWQPTQRASLLQRLTIWQNATIKYNKNRTEKYSFLREMKINSATPQKKVQTLTCLQNISHFNTKMTKFLFYIPTFKEVLFQRKRHRIINDFLTLAPIRNLTPWKHDPPPKKKGNYIFWQTFLNNLVNKISLIEIIS